MRTARLLALSLVVQGGTAHATRETGRVTHWDSDHRRIVTDVTLMHDDGSVETVRRTGGTVDGIGMLQIDLDALASPVIDFVQTRTPKSGVPLHWVKSCVYVTPDAAGTSDLEGDLEFQIILDALANWETRTRSCGYLRLIAEPPTAGEVGYDGVNLVKFRQDRWCSPAHGSNPEECYDRQAAAITTLSYVNRPGTDSDGMILDADVEVNAVDFAVAADGETLGRGTPSELANTFTHELGHVIGLDHTCWDRAGTAPPDDDGNPAPSCQPLSSLSPKVTEATMFNYEAAGETKKASLEQDDIDGFCKIYPLADDPMVCSPALESESSGCGCRAAPSRAPGGEAGGLAWLGLAALFVRRRR